MSDEKLREYFDGMVVYKDLSKINFLSSLRLPSFLRDWLLQKFCDEDGNYSYDEVSRYVNDYLPRQEEWTRIKNSIIYENEWVKLFTRISVDININSREKVFALPELNLTYKETIIEDHVWEECKDQLIHATECWGIVELGYRPPDENASPKIPGKIKLVSFKNFCPYTVETDYYKDTRSEFTTQEWIDILLGAVDYQASGYRTEDEKLSMLKRLLPFTEKNLNLIELAPKGTGKSYLFGNISRHGVLVDGGRITRAKMFYDISRKKPGFICGSDYVAIDEVKLVTFGDVHEMRSIMQGYMERGMFNCDGFEGSSDSGIVFLGNIEQKHMNETENMMEELPELFKESALLDRIHGFIKGWEIPNIREDMKIKGWALNSEYFCSILHLLREDISYRAIVDEMIEVPSGSYIRHVEAVKRLCSAYLKLLFPNVRKVSDISPYEFSRYCLQPAVEMRSIILRQLEILDKDEYGKVNKAMPELTLKDRL